MSMETVTSTNIKNEITEDVTPVNEPCSEIMNTYTFPSQNNEVIKNVNLTCVFEPCFIETDNKTLKFKCPMCKKKYKSKEKVLEHVNSHITVHSIYTKGNLKCSECNSYFQSEDSLNLHWVSHKKIRGRPRNRNDISSDNDVKPFICDKCAKSFKTKQQLLTHHLVHEYIKPFECSNCEKSFKLKQQLQNHIKIHEDLRSFICDICEKSFKFKQQLENHHKSHSDIRPFKCILCEKAFKFKQQLQMHQRVHDDLRNFKCDLCDKAFKFKQQLQCHAKVHSDERPFQCPVCEKSFKLKQQLQTHLKVHTKHFLDSKLFEPKIDIETNDSNNLDASMKNTESEHTNKSIESGEKIQNKKTKIGNKTIVGLSNKPPDKNNKDFIESVEETSEYSDKAIADIKKGNKNNEEKNVHNEVLNSGSKLFYDASKEKESTNLNTIEKHSDLTKQISLNNASIEHYNVSHNKNCELMDTDGNPIEENLNLLKEHKLLKVDAASILETVNSKLNTSRTMINRGTQQVYNITDTLKPTEHVNERPKFNVRTYQQFSICRL
ncbi:hypothetical protein NQ317_016368 [Molorchus minor]|uniref:C2H2-type domain-containing protein n=1 Tax=Molorchus minor TaxID=1323400 RepID=A0ABQ9JC41_9CUCU|nr:hypothetical protein NQ317_016368 [Molorchus minor]